MSRAILPVLFSAFLAIGAASTVYNVAAPAFAKISAALSVAK